MKTYNKNYFFSNFDKQISNRFIEKNNLSINSIVNLKSNNNIIDPVCNFSDFMKTFLGYANYQIYLSNNENIINNLIYVLPYNYYESSLNKIENRLFALDSNFKIYEYDFSIHTFIDLDFQFNELPEIKMFNNSLYIYNYGGLFLMINKNNTPLNISTPINVKSFINYQDLSLFLTTDNIYSIFTTAKTDFLNIESETNLYSEIQLMPEDGKILDIVVYKNNIYAVQQFGITKLSYSNNEFKIYQTCSIQSQIIENTICLIDDIITFYTSAGLFIFDGNDIKQVFNNITKNITSYVKRALSYNNKYYLNCKYFINDVARNLILEFDFENDTCSLFDIGDVVDIYLIKELANYSLNAIVKTDESYSVLTLDNLTITNFKKYIKFNKVVFDDKMLKVLNEFKIQACGEFKLTISTDMQESVFFVKNKMHLKNLGIKGQYFEFECESENSFLIESIAVKLTDCEED